MQVINHYLAGAPVSKWIDADCKLIGPVWTGDDNKGQLYSPLWRGAGGAIEDWITPLPAGYPTDPKGTVRIDWDKSANTVHYSIKLYHMKQSPSIARVDGGDPEITDPNNPNHYIAPPAASWWANKFHTNPKNMPIKASDGTGYRLWTIFATFNTKNVPFFYDGQTLKLLGSGLDFPSGPPSGTIGLGIGVGQLVSSALLYPDASGFATREYTVPYGQVTTEGGYYGYFVAAFVPQNLCKANPYQPAQGQLRPYVSKWQTPSQASPWNVILRNGISFDLTVEEGRPDVPPGGNDQNEDYIYSGISYAANNPSAPGGVPLGWHFSLPAAIANVQPALYPIPATTGLLSDPLVNAPLYCLGQ